MKKKRAKVADSVDALILTVRESDNDATLGTALGHDTNLHGREAQPLWMREFILAGRSQAATKLIAKSVKQSRLGKESGKPAVQAMLNAAYAFAPTYYKLKSENLGAKKGWLAREAARLACIGESTARKYIAMAESRWNFKEPD